MFSFTRKTEYALIALAELMQRREWDEQAVSARAIADQYRLPLPLLMNILKELNSADLVNSTRGSQGGYSLAVEPEQVSLLQVVELMEGPLRLVPCAGQDAEEEKADPCECQLMGDCLVHDAIQSLHGRIVEFLEQMTLADLLEQETDKRIPLMQAGN